MRACEVSKRTARHGPQVISTGPQSQPLLYISIRAEIVGVEMLPMVLGFSCSKPSHICIEADPLVFRMSVLDFATLHQR